MSDDIERGPCPRCSEPAALAARVCPHCRGSALVDVALEQPVSDPRQRYLIARSIVAIGLPGVSLGPIQSALGLAGAPIVRGLTRAAARPLVGLLAERGVKAASLPAREAASAHGPVGSSRTPPPGSKRMPLTTVAVAVAVFAGLGAWNRLRPRLMDTQAMAATSIRSGTVVPVSATSTDRGPGDRPALGLTTRQIAERATPSTVSLRCRDSVGAGFFVSPDLLLSNAHVACSEDKLIRVLMAGGRELTAEVVERDETLDLAVFRIPGANVTPLPLGDATRMGPGDKVVMIGSPRGLEFTVHEGIVSNAGRNYLGVAYLQIDANVNPGNSGGPLLDGQGRVVGIVSMMVGRSSGLGLVLPINYAYEGLSPLVQPSWPKPDSTRWTELLTSVRETDKREADQMSTAFEEWPGGIVSLTSSRGVPIAVVARRFTVAEPPADSGTFVVFQGGRRQCERTYPIDRWRRVRDDEQGSDRRFYRWMERNGITRDLFVGFADLTAVRSDCSQVDWHTPAELRLEHARAPVDTILLSPDGRNAD
jgi:serine protease Do